MRKALPLALSTRLLLASALLLPLFLGLSAYLLDLAFQRSLIAAEKERLNAHIYLLLAAAELQNDELWLPDELTEPRFSQVNSGLYGFVYNVAGDEVWRSPSARVLGPVPTSDARLQPGRGRFGDVAVDERRSFRFTYDVVWETAEGGEKPYRFSVVHGREAYRSELAAYRQQLWWLLGGLAILLLIAQTLIMRWGLRPLKTMAGKLRDVERGEAGQLEGEYPAELRRVTDNLNRVLKTERIQRERYRDTLSDLAHSLKTPLAVLRGSLSEPDDHLRRQAGEQITRMDEIISHQLQRAVSGAPLQTGRSVSVRVVAERIAEALKKVYADKAVHVEIDDRQRGRFHGAESDLMELLGNLLDNAFKYAAGHVAITLSNKGGALILRIDDDGPGVPEHLQKRILERGARADTAQSGYGIGLAVAAEIIASYGGSLEVGDSPEGGARFKVAMPYSPDTLDPYDR